MKVTLNPAALNNMEQKAREENNLRDKYIVLDLDNPGLSSEETYKLQEILEEIIDNNDRRKAVFDTLTSPIRSVSGDIPLDGEEFCEIIRLLYPRYNWDK